MRTHLGYTILIISAIGFLAFPISSCSSSQEKKEAKYKAAIVEEVKNLITKWDANKIWYDPRGIGRMSMIFTAEVQRYLAENKRPIVIKAKIKDIIQQEDGSLVALFVMENFIGEPKAYFRLIISAEQYRYLLSKEIIGFSRTSLDNFVLFIKVTGVQATVDTATQPLIMGSCLDVIYIGTLSVSDF
jgi:hypothetical protein